MSPKDISDCQVQVWEQQSGPQVTWVPLPYPTLLCVFEQEGLRKPPNPLFLTCREFRMMLCRWVLQECASTRAEVLQFSYTGVCIVI